MISSCSERRGQTPAGTARAEAPGLERSEGEGWSRARGKRPPQRRITADKIK